VATETPVASEAIFGDPVRDTMSSTLASIEGVHLRSIAGRRTSLFSFDLSAMTHLRVRPRQCGARSARDAIEFLPKFFFQHRVPNRGVSRHAAIPGRRPVSTGKWVVVWAGLDEFQSIPVPGPVLSAAASIMPLIRLHFWTQTL